MLAIEANMEDVAPINDYILTNQGELWRLLSSLDEHWRAPEVLDLIKWLRAHHASPGSARRVTLVGFDFQNAAQAMRAVENYLSKVDPDAQKLAHERYHCFRTVRADYSDYAQWPVIEQVECQQKLQQVYDDLQRQRAAYEAASSPPAGSYEQLLRSANLPRLLLDLRGISPRIPAFEWFNEPKPLRAMGATYDATRPDAYFYAARLRREFDALVSFQNVAAAMPTLGGFGADSAAAATYLKSLPTQPRNLDFEDGLSGWNSGGTATSASSYEVGIDSAIKHGGRHSLHITSKSSTDALFITQSIRTDDYRGKRLRFSAYLKAERIDGWAGLRMHNRSSSFPSVAFDDMHFRPLTGTRDWQPYELVFDVPADHEVLILDIELHGRGQLWVDDARLEVVGDDVPLTYLQGWPDKPSNLDFEDGKTGWEFNQAVGTSDQIEVGLDNQAVHSGRFSGALKVKTAGQRPNAIMQSFKAEAYRGQRVRLSAYLKMEDVTGDAIMQVSARGRYADFASSGTGLLRGTRDWQRYELLYDVPEDADTLSIDIISGSGQLWVDDVQFEIVP